MKRFDIVLLVSLSLKRAFLASVNHDRECENIDGELRGHKGTRASCALKSPANALKLLMEAGAQKLN